MLNIDALNEKFTERFSLLLKEEGYRLKDKSYRKERRNRLFVIEAGLNIEEADGGYIVSPEVRICDVPLKKGLVSKKYAPDECDIEFIKQNGGDKVFYKKLRHLESVFVKSGEEMTDEQLETLLKTALVAPRVCENRAIPAYYKKLCKNDIPISKALYFSLISFLGVYVIIIVLIALCIGLAVYLRYGFTRIWGLFLVPYYYIVTLIPSLIYGIVVFVKTRKGRF